MSRTLKSILLASCLLAPVNVLAEGGLPAALIRIPESVRTVFVAETSTAKFHRFEGSAGGIVHSGSFYMSIGEEGPGKMHSGDRRTPLGVYFVTERLDTSKLHERYGVTAFPLDYPNAWDQRADRDGDGIWVHGVQRNGGQRPERDTDGWSLKITSPNGRQAKQKVISLASCHSMTTISNAGEWTRRSGLLCNCNQPASAAFVT